jgi:hypothetical protein
MAAFVKFHCFVEHLAEKVHDLQNDSLKIMLSNTAPSQSNTVKTDITEIASTSNGYTAGGTALSGKTSSQTSGLYTLDASDVVFTQSGANAIGPFRYVILYNDTPSTSPIDPLIGYWDYGASGVTLAGSSAETFTVDFTTGVLTIQ